MKDIELQTEAFKRYIQECDELSITPDYASAFNAAWNARAAVEADRAQRVPDGFRMVSVEMLTRWRDAFAEELGAWDIDPPIHHVQVGFDETSALLASTPAPAQQERKPMTNAPTEVEKLMDAAGLCRRCAEPTDTRGVKDVLAERQRQIKSEGYSPESDDAYWQNDLVKAAVCYAWPMYPMREGVGEDPHDQRKWAPDLWPWEARHWKPKDRRSNLVRAGALILAEIERLDRAAERHHGIKE